MKKIWLIIFVLLLNGLTFAKQTTKHAKHKAPVLNPQVELQKLIDGNKRFATHHLKHPDESVARRIQLARKGQHPFAIILSCSDSRLPPEIIFDEGLGDLFVVRIAGNIADDAVIASIEYAAEHLGASLLMVLGHEKCGAVNAAIANQREGHISALVDAIHSAVEDVQASQGKKQADDSPKFHEQVAKANVKTVIGRLRASEPILAHLIAEKKLMVVGGYYHLASGKVSLLHD